MDRSASTLPLSLPRSAIPAFRMHAVSLRQPSIGSSYRRRGHHQRSGHCAQPGPRTERSQFWRQPFRTRPPLRSFPPSLSMDPVACISRFWCIGLFLALNHDRHGHSGLRHLPLYSVVPVSMEAGRSSNDRFCCMSLHSQCLSDCASSYCPHGLHGGGVCLSFPALRSRRYISPL